MITNIYLNPEQQKQLDRASIEEMRATAIKCLPYPLAVSFRNYFNANQKKEKTSALVIFVNDITPSVFQFLSLVLVSEYIESNAPRTIKLYQAVENMTYRPGPGKWLGFLREFYFHAMNNTDTLGKFSEIINFLEINEINKRNFFLTVEENNGESPAKKLGLLELMVNLRNNFAHTRGYDSRTLDPIYLSLSNIVDLLCLHLLFLCDYRLIYTPNKNSEEIILKGISLPKRMHNHVIDLHNLAIATQTHRTQLFPLVINDQNRRTKSHDIFLLESIDNKKVLFAANRVTSLKRTDQDKLAVLVVKALRKIYVEPEIFKTDLISWGQFRDRVLQYSTSTLSEYVLNGKYDEEVYVPPKSLESLMKLFYSSDKKILFLRDSQGSGKSALCAFLTDGFIKENNLIKASFLLDARLLDEIGDKALLFDEFINRNLGLQGSLCQLFSRFEKKYKHFEFTIIIDNLNEYFFLGKDQAHLMDRLFDLLYRWKDYSGIRFIAFARPEYFERSIKKYYQSFRDKYIQDYTHMHFGDKDGIARITTPLPALSDIELGQIWKNFAETYTGHSPKTSWVNLSPDVKKHCRTPLIMLFLLRLYDNRHIPENLTMDKIKKEYINNILNDKSLRSALFDMVQLMHKYKKPFLLTEDLNQKQLKKIQDSSKNPSTLLPHNLHYKTLNDIKLLREEKVVKGNLIGKKISVNTELTLDIINEEFRKSNKKLSLFLIAFNSFAGLLGSTFFIFYMHRRLFAELNHVSLYLTQAFNEINLPESLNSLSMSVLCEIINQNYIYKTGTYSFLGNWISLLIITNIALIVCYVFIFYKNKNSSAKRFSFYELLYFKNLEKKFDSRYLQIALPIVVSFLLLIAIMALTIKSSYWLEQFSTATLIILVVVLLVMFSMNLFRAFKQDVKYADYYLHNNLLNIFQTIGKTVPIAILFWCVFYFSPIVLNFVSGQINTYYSQKFIEETGSLGKELDNEAKNELITYFDQIESDACPLNMTFVTMSAVFNNDRVDLLESFYKIERTSSLYEQVYVLREHSMNYWYMFILFPFFISMIVVVIIGFPLLLIKVNQSSKEQVLIV